MLSIYKLVSATESPTRKNSVRIICFTITGFKAWCVLPDDGIVTPKHGVK